MRLEPALTVAAAATLALYVVPGGRLLGRPLVLLSTFVHELGHGLAAMLVGGRFRRLHLYRDASGMAVFEGRASRLARAIVAAGGPLGPPIAAAALFFAARTGEASAVALYAFAAVLLVVCVVWVRNAFAVFFVLVLAVAAGAAATYTTAREARIACAFLAIQLTLSVFSRGDYLFSVRARTSQGDYPSDTKQIADALFLPYWFWGALLAAISLAVLALGAYAFAEGR